MTGICLGCSRIVSSLSHWRQRHHLGRAAYSIWALSTGPLPHKAETRCQRHGPERTEVGPDRPKEFVRPDGGAADSSLESGG